MAEGSNEQRARRIIELFNAGDWDTYRNELVGDSYLYEETGTGRRLETFDAALEVLKGWKVAFPDIRGEVLRVVSEGDEAVMEIRWTGTQTGPLEGPAGELPPSNRSFDAMAVMWVTFRDGRIVAKRHFLDLLTTLAQIGAMPVAV